jgi:uncharacterized protein YjdB
MATKLKFRVNTKNMGWTGWVQSGGIAGNPGDSTDQVLALEVLLEEKPNDIRITYAVNVKEPNFWTPLVSDGNTAGFPFSNLAVDRIYADLINAGGFILLYSVSTNPVGWTPWVVSSNTNSSDGVGLDGFPIQAVKMFLFKTP